MSKQAVYEPTAVEPRISSLISMSARELVSTIIGGLVVGLIVVGLYLLLNQFVFGSVLCRPQSSAECAQAPTYAMIVAQIIGGIAGIGVLVRMRIYRPMLVVIASIITLWTLQQLISPLAWYIALIAGAVLFGLAYGLYAWVARIRSFVLAVVITVILIVLVRIAFM